MEPKCLLKRKIGMATIEQEIKSSQDLSDQCLTERLTSSVGDERNDLGAVLIHLAEFDRRRLGPSKGYPSLFAYCTTILKYSSPAAARRIAVARAGRRYPSLLAMVRKGELHLEGAAMLAPLLNPENRRRLFRQARGRSLEEIGRIVASAAPQALKRDHIRIVAIAPQPASADPVLQACETEETPLSRAPSSIAPSEGDWAAVFGPGAPVPPTEEFYRVSFDADQETMKMLRRAQELLRHKFPKAELNQIVKTALNLLLNQEDRDRKPPRLLSAPISVKAGRRIPEGVKQAAWTRDRGVCTWVGTGGLLCRARAWLEFDHLRPVALGGPSDLENVRLLCREHNRLAAHLIFEAKSVPEPVLTG